MPLKLTVAEAVRLGLLPPEDAPPAPAVSLPVIRPLTLAPRSHPHSQAFKILDAALRLSGAHNGAPVIRWHSRTLEREIVITPALAYRAQCTRAATRIVLVVNGQTTTRTFPALTPDEFCSLWLLWKE